MNEKPEANRVVTVAELLARHGQASGTAGRVHRRRARDGGISVAELTGEIPIIRDYQPDPEREAPEEVPEPVREPEPVAPVSDEVAADDHVWEWDYAETTADEQVWEYDPAAADEQVWEYDPAATAAHVWEYGESTAAETAVIAENLDDVEEARAYSALDAVADAGRQSPREFASTSSFSVMMPLAGSIHTADLDDEYDSSFDESAFDESGPDESAFEDSPPEEYAPEESADAEPQKDALRQWLALGAQAVVGVAVGGVLFVGFERLWDNLAYVALVLAILVILAMVAVVRILRKTDDIVSILIAVVVGVIVTIGPLAFVLSTR